MFNPDEARYANGVLVELPYPTNDVRLITKADTQAVERLFRPGFRYSKAEVLLMDLRQPGEFTDDLFAHTQPAMADKVMSVLDEINDRWGRGTLRTAAVPAWGMCRELKSSSYITRLDQLWTVNNIYCALDYNFAHRAEADWSLFLLVVCCAFPRGIAKGSILES